MARMQPYPATMKLSKYLTLHPFEEALGVVVFKEALGVILSESESSSEEASPWNEEERDTGKDEVGDELDESSESESV